MTKKTITTISSYVKAICDLNAKLDKNVTIHKAELLYRGQANTEFKLIPGLGRNRNHMTSVSIFNEERNLDRKSVV